MLGLSRKFWCNLSVIFNDLNLFSIFVCFFMIAKYQGQLQIFNKVVLNGVYQFRHCIVLILFFLTLVWTSLDNCISQKKKQQDVTLCNILHAKLVLRNSSFKSSLYLQWQWDLCIIVEKSPIFVGNKFKIYCVYDWPWLWLIVFIALYY